MSEKSFFHIRCKRPSTNERGRRRRSNLRSQLMNNPLQTPSCHTDWIMDWPIDVITSGPAKTSPTERGKESPRCVWLPPGRVIPSFWTSSPPLPSSSSPCSSPSTKSPIGELQMQTSRPADNSNLWPSPACRFLYNCPPVAAPHCVYICVMETHEYLYTWAAWEQRLTLCPIKYKYEGKYKYKYMNIYTDRPPENNVYIITQLIQVQKPTCVARIWHAWPKIWMKLKSTPHICHGYHRRCLCKNFLSGVNFSRLSEKMHIFNFFRDIFSVFGAFSRFFWCKIWFSKILSV